MLTRDECWRPHIVAIVRLLMLIGCRLSEVVSLEWDWNRGKCIHLPDWKSGPHPIWLSIMVCSDGNWPQFLDIRDLAVQPQRACACAETPVDHRAPSVQPKMEVGAKIPPDGRAVRPHRLSLIGITLCRQDGHIRR